MLAFDFGGFIFDASATRAWVALAVLAILLLLRILSSRYEITSANFPVGVPLPTPASTASLSRRYRDEFDGQFDDEESESIGRLFLGASDALRISEKVEVENNTYVHNLRMIAQKPAMLPSSQRWPQVVAWNQKGKPLASFTMEVAGTSQARTLTFAETAGALLHYASGLLDTGMSDIETEEFELVLASVITSYGAPTTRQREVLTEKWSSLKAALVEANVDRARIEKLSELVQNSARVYPVIALIPSDTELARIKLSFRSPVKVERAKGWERKALQRAHFVLCSTIGLSQRSHQIRLTHALLAPSYHLDFVAPRGLYVYDAVAVLSVPSGSSSMNLVAPNGLHVDPRLTCIDKQRGDSLAVQGRDLQHIVASRPDSARSAAFVQPTLAIEFRERPPGALALLTGVSLLLAFMLLFVSYWHNYVFGLATLDPKCLSGAFGVRDNPWCRPQPSTVWPAILFTLPALVSAWLASKASRESIASLSISTVSIFGWLAINTIFAAALVAVKMTFPFARRFDFQIFETNQFAWTILLLSSVACAVMSSLLLVFKTSRYRRRTV